RGVRRSHRRPIPDREQAMDLRSLRLADDGLDGARFLMKAHGQGSVRPRVFELVAAIGGEDLIDTEALGGLTKHAGLITSGRREQEHTSHSHRFTPEQPALLSAPLNNTKARSGTGWWLERARAKNVPGYGS